MARNQVSRIAAYGLPGLPLAALGLPLYLYLPAFYAEERGLGLALVGILLLAARTFDVVSDPLAGIIADRLPSRYRRKLLIAIATPLLMAGVVALFRPPPDAGASWLLAWSLVTYAGWTLLTLPYTAWGAELSNDYDARSSISASREGAILLGTLLAATIPVALGLGSEQTGAILDVLATWLVLLLPITVLAALVLVPEPPVHRKPIALTVGWRLLVENRPFRRLLLAYLANGVANGLPATLFVLYVTHVLALPEQFGVLLGAYFLSGIAGLPLGLVLSRRIGKHRTWTLSMLWAVAVFAWVPLLSSGDFWPFLAICVFSGLSLGIDLALPAAIQADVVDLDTQQGGGQRTGLFFGLWGMATKLALALAVGIAFPLLDLAGFDANSTQSMQATLALALLYGGLPIPFKLAAAALMWRFPLDREAQRAISRNLHAETVQ